MLHVLTKNRFLSINTTSFFLCQFDHGQNFNNSYIIISTRIHTRKKVVIDYYILAYGRKLKKGKKNFSR